MVIVKISFSILHIYFRFQRISQNILNIKNVWETFVEFSLYFIFSGFYDECKRRYNVKLWKTFTDCFNCLPIAAIIDEKIFCCHGGLSPDLQSMEQIRRIMRPTDVPDTGECLLIYKQIVLYTNTSSEIKLF